MTLKVLPEIKALAVPEGTEWDIPSSVYERWQPAIRAASDEPGQIAIYDGIGEQWDGTGTSSRRIAAALRALGESEVVVSLNSPGGDFFEGIAIYNLLREHKGRVTVKVLGLAASAASIIAMAADRLEIARSGYLMIHNAWSVVMGNRHDLKEAIAVLEGFDSTMASVYADRSGLEHRRLAAMMDNETWLDGESAVELKLADALLPGDEITRSNENKITSELRQIDIGLAKAGLSRSKRRDLLKRIPGTPSATHDATPSAGLNYALQALKLSLT